MNLSVCVCGDIMGPSHVCPDKDGFPRAKIWDTVATEQATFLSVCASTLTTRRGRQEVSSAGLS